MITDRIELKVRVLNADELVIREKGEFRGSLINMFFQNKARREVESRVMSKIGGQLPAKLKLEMEKVLAAHGVRARVDIEMD